MHECPEWGGAIPRALRRQFDASVAALYQHVALVASTRIIDSRECRAWHSRLFSDVVPIDYYAGNFRQHDLSRPCLGVDRAVGSLQGASFHFVPDRCENLFESVRREIARSELGWSMLTEKQRALRLAQVIAGMLGEFIRIHPFINGNGRVSRVMWAWGLVRFGAPIQCRITPRPSPPYKDLMAAAMRGDDFPLARAILFHLSVNCPSLPTG